MNFVTSPFLRRVVFVLAATAAGLLAPAAAQVPASSVPLTPETTPIKKLLEQKFQGVSIGSISKSPYFGLY
jgi:hypothetical protein